jgi:acyl dehydratase
MESIANLYFEDVVVGHVFRTRAHAISEDDIRRFCDLTLDHHPLHENAEYARARGFPGVIAHGLFGLSLIEGLKAETRLYEQTSVASLGWDAVRFKKPLLAGDAVHVVCRFAEKRPTRQPDRGVVVEELTLVNQAGDTVIEARHAALVLLRGSSPEIAAG